MYICMHAIWNQTLLKGVKTHVVGVGIRTYALVNSVPYQVENWFKCFKHDNSQIWPTKTVKVSR